MGGGLMQLVAYGAQDVYHRQTSDYQGDVLSPHELAMEAIEQSHRQADFGRRVRTVSRNGDLAYRTYLQVTLPRANRAWLMINFRPAGRFSREQLVSQVEVEIGGQRIDRQYGDWMHIWNQLTMTAEQETGYHKMIGHTTQLTYLTNSCFSVVDGPCSTCPRSSLRSP